MNAPRVAFVMERVLGHATWALSLRAALASLGVDVVWVETSLYREGGVPERVPFVPAVARAGVRALLDVRRGLAGQCYDALLFNTQKAAMLCQAYLLRTPTMLMTDVTPAQYDRISGPYEHHADEVAPLAAAKRAVNALNFRLARAVIGWSRWTADSFVREYGVSRERVHVVPPAVDTREWRPAARPRSLRPRLLFVGGNFARKGGPALVEAFHDLGLADRAELHIVTRDEVASQPGVHVHRDMANGSDALRELYREADVFVLPTVADCFSIASIEAMAVGLPVIVTDVGGISDIVVDGETGFLLRPNDGHGLRAAMAALVDDPDLRGRLGAAARARAVRHFDSRDSARRLLDIAAAITARPADAMARRGA
ncbi:MAG TPA: glycosyltransferase family 4 protein [Candidatus Acidoferrales bacterium]|nr:glycosyltransferase family 4 protein [Candidatus Acidoferrales bacterium]